MGDSEALFYFSSLQCAFRGHVTVVEAQEARSEGYILTVSDVILRIHTFNPNELVWVENDHAFMEGTTKEAGDLNTPHNFVRFHLARWAPPHIAPKFIYIDTDVIVNADICELHDGAFRNFSKRCTNCLSKPVLAAVPRPHLPISTYLRTLSPQSVRWLPSFSQSFNAGVMVIDMVLWEQENVTDRVRELVQLNRAGRFWRHGSQPPLLMLLYDRVEWLDESWNIDGLGYKRGLRIDLLSKGKILHWTGPFKPWFGNGLYRELWTPFARHCWTQQEDLLRA